MTRDPEATPVVLHQKPAPMVVRSGQVPPSPMPPPLPRRASTPLGGTLAPLGRVPVPGPEVFTTDEPVTPANTAPHLVNKHLRVYLALPPEDRQLVHAFALRLLPGSR